MPDWTKVSNVARRFGTRHKVDVLFYNGPLERGFDHDFIVLCRKRKRRKAVVLILVTSGGDAHAAYRMGRCLQRMYDRVTVFVPGWCKSAGTLLAIAAHQLIISDLGELGPIDVQRAKQDDLWGSSSGLTEDAAIDTLETAALQMFEKFLFRIKALSAGQITFKTASEAAAPMVVGALSPIFAQIDPLKIGENSRAIRIANDYGLRLNVASRSLISWSSMENLVSGYSTHGFVIDREEAKELFKNVSAPERDHEELCEHLGKGAYAPINESKPWIKYLNPEVKSRRLTRKKKGPVHGTRKRQQVAPAVADTNAVGDIGGTAAAAAVDTESNVSPLQRPGSKK